MNCSRCTSPLKPGKTRCTACGAFTFNGLSATDDESSEDEFHDTSKPLTASKNADKSRIDFDFWNPVFGGGLVTTSTVVLAGTPGAGKTTGTMGLMSSVLQRYPDRCVVLVESEMIDEEIKCLADRLEIPTSIQERIRFVDAMANPGNIIEVFKIWKPIMGVFDSLQSLTNDDLMMQVTLCKMGKKFIAAPMRCPLIFISHVDKGGDIAGLEKLQHEVDTTIVLESVDETLRHMYSKKNRNGATKSLFLEMTELGLRYAPQVENPA